MEVAEGRLPKDRIALRELYREIMDWPFVEASPEEAEEEDGASSSSPYEAITPTGVEGDNAFPSNCFSAGALPCKADSYSLAISRLELCAEQMSALIAAALRADCLAQVCM